MRESARKGQRSIRGLMLVAAAGFLAAPARASEGGNSAYPNGANGWMEGALPPSGWYFIPYASHYSANRFNDGDGNRSVPGFDLDVDAVTVRLVRVWPGKIAGFSLASQLIQPMLALSVHAAGARGDRITNGDLMMTPLIVGRQIAPNLHLAAGVDVYMPTGSYAAGRLVNGGLNRWTMTPDVALSFRTERVEASVKLMYDFNFENSATHYDSGDAFHADYRLGYYFRPTISVGVEGFAFVQTTDDRQEGMRVGDDGFRGRVFGIGPAATVILNAVPITLSWKREFGARNRPEGDVIWLRGIVKF